MSDKGPGMVKSTDGGGTGFTVRLTVVEWPGPLPVMVNVNCPVGVVDVVVTLSVEFVLPGGVTDVGFRVQVVPAGQPETVRATKLLNPLSAVTVTVELPEPPCVSVNELGLAESEKSGAEEPQLLNLNAPMCVYHP